MRDKMNGVHALPGDQAMMYLWERLGKPEHKFRERTRDGRGAQEKQGGKVPAHAKLEL